MCAMQNHGGGASTARLRSRSCSGLFVTAFLVVGMLSAALAAAYEVPPNPDMVSVSAVGEALAEPDVARVVFTIRVEATDHEEARVRGAKHADAVGEVLQQYVIERKDIKTQTVRVSPLHEWRERHRNDRRPSRIVVGYEYLNSVSITVRDLERVSALVEDVLKISPDGEVSLGSLAYVLEDREQHELLARESAVRKARQYATVLAEGAGAALGRVISIHCSEETSYYPKYSRGMHPDMMMMESSVAGAYADDSGAPAPPSAGIQGGGIEKLRVSVSVTWEIDNSGINHAQRSLEHGSKAEEQ
ncbi:26 kDa periplasmic immunogenic protein [Porphyridium purpureum]|uniref:26 kDa periplasmic immunogenic protein n=1 Tax=Porphyridium purpureum TaxID=35688 RepID=A0A5J4YK78_PORPP|nr:26 kDa periplasmic immunogenic protein [Porphyridium purpureum]|eukprot:POR0356..scf297_16